MTKNECIDILFTRGKKVSYHLTKRLNGTSILCQSYGVHMEKCNLTFIFGDDFISFEKCAQTFLSTYKKFAVNLISGKWKMKKTSMDEIINKNVVMKSTVLTLF